MHSSPPVFLIASGWRCLTTSKHKPSFLKLHSSHKTSVSIPVHSRLRCARQRPDVLSSARTIILLPQAIFSKGKFKARFSQDQSDWSRGEVCGRVGSQGPGMFPRSGVKHLTYLGRAHRSSLRSPLEDTAKAHEHRGHRQKPS